MVRTHAARVLLLALLPVAVGAPLLAAAGQIEALPHDHVVLGGTAAEQHAAMASHTHHHASSHRDVMDERAVDHIAAHDDAPHDGARDGAVVVSVPSDGADALGSLDSVAVGSAAAAAPSLAAVRAPVVVPPPSALGVTPGVPSPPPRAAWRPRA